MSVLQLKQTFCRRMAMLFLVLIINELLTPSIALALTGGPSQPEVHGFEPVGTSDMVDLSTGDFNYNIPLMDAGGYPLNISYHAGATADDEGSWVGLGWNLTPGAMNRDMRGLPDDFKGDEIKKEFNIKEDVTVGINAGAKFQLAGIYLGKIGKSKVSGSVGIGLNLGGFKNSYRGFGIEYGVSPSLSLGAITEGKSADGQRDSTVSNSPTVNLGASLKYNSQSGLDADLSVGVRNIGLSKTEGALSLAANVGIGFNSRQGLKELTFGSSLNQERKDKSSGSLGLGSGSVSFASRTYVPTSAMPMMNTASTFHGTVGGEWWSLHPSFQLTGYRSVQKLQRHTQQQPAYGYLNSQSAQNDKSAVMDYNKEKQMPYRASQPNLPLSIGTYDLFSATGQGVSGQFRAMRNDVGTFRTPNNTNQSQSLNLGLELGFGNVVHGGLEVRNTDVTSTAGDWNDGKGAATNLTFTDQTGAAASADYEPVFIKNTGESATSSTVDFRNTTGDNAPIALQMKTDKGVSAQDYMRKEIKVGGIKDVLPAFSSAVKRDKREKRSQVFSYLTAYEASKIGLDKTIKSYKMNTRVIGMAPNDITQDIRNKRPAHHISEVSVTQGDGSRYVYGIPAYNELQEEAAFAVNANNVKKGTLSSYTPELDNTIGNKQGRDNYYDAQTLPPYAHSYLLTGVVSADYVDVGNDGITDDDLGTNVKINYTKAVDKYNWRTPYDQNYARHNEGYKSDTRDDKASYVYGQKEIWYTHSIETKTMVAQFFLSDRKDGLGVIGKNGGKDVNQKLKRLDRIELYSKSALLAGNTTPIKTVNFEYDYSLCKGAPNITADNTEGGKLTLRKIYFTYGNNKSGKLNAYKFKYNGDNAADLKFSYNIDNYDRWGSYKEASANLNGIENKYFPYATQNKDLADKYAKGWNMTQIELPSGGRIRVDYEADDYAFVQDKRAGQMFPIKGFSRVSTATPDNKLYDNNIFINNIFIPGQSKYLHIDIATYNMQNVADFKKRFLEDVKQIYFTCKVNLKNDLNTGEYIKGYADMDAQEDISLSPDKKTAIIPIVLAASGMNPVAKIALQTMRLELPSLVYENYEDTETSASLKSILGKFMGVFPEVWRTLRGFERAALDKKWVQSVDLAASWVRLANPNYKKLGGGCRVKKIKVSNYASDEPEANTGANPNDANYGQLYTYTTTNPANGTEMSSGVASYEPMVGNEENLFREPVTYEEKIRMAPNNAYYMEKPFGESLFPSPSIVYSSVKVQSLEPATSKRTGTGYTVHEFFTAKDFPTVVDYTTKQHEDYNPNTGFSLLDFFKLDKKHHVGASQGYTIEVNDMHGKPKAEYVRNAYDVDISWTKYDYRTDGANHIKNDGIDVVNTEGVIGQNTIGYDVDIWHDMQQDKTTTEASGMSMNTEVFLVFGFPIPLIPIFPALNREETVFRSAVTTKFVKRFGILNKVTKMENGSTVSTENLLFDSETGQPLLTKTQNEFRDEMYQFSYPAHWAYDEGMGQAYKNLGLVANGVAVAADGSITSTDFSKYFVPGDELLIRTTIGGGIKYFLPNRYNIVMVSGTKRIVDPTGNFLPAGTYTLKVTRSGRRNQASAVIASVVSRKDPRQGNQLVFDKQILTAQAATFKDDWAVKSGQTLNCQMGTRNELEYTYLFDQYGFRTLVEKLASGQVGYEPRIVSEIILRNADNPFISGNDPVFILGNADPNFILKIPFLNFGPMGAVTLQVLTPYQQWYTGTFKMRINDNCFLMFEPRDASNLNKQYTLVNAIMTQDKSPYRMNCMSSTGDIIEMKVYSKCDTCISTCRPLLAAGDKINPYQLGIKGNWRPDAAYALYTQRTAPLSIAAKNVRTDGDVVDYKNFWKWNTNKKLVVNDNVDEMKKWVKTNTITHYDDKGNDIENVDALNIYSSALFRYKNTLASAVAANARRREIAFDGFEDYGYSTTAVEQQCGVNHFDFALNPTVDAALSSTKAHTGNFSFKVAANKLFSRPIAINASDVLNNDNDNTAVVNPNDHRQIQRVLPAFALSKNKAYVLSSWLSKDGKCTPTDMTKVKMAVLISYADGTATVDECLPAGTIVEGWQRIETAFTTKNVDITKITVELSNSLTDAAAYMDDLRILPADGKMKSFVYDSKTLRLMAQLDENNYATFYEYDDEGTLVRTKRETERGIVTIQENRSTLYRPPVNIIALPDPGPKTSGQIQISAPTSSTLKMN